MQNHDVVLATLRELPKLDVEVVGRSGYVHFLSIVPAAIRAKRARRAILV